MTALIELSHLTKDYGKFRALSDVNLTLRPGVTGLLGPNGAGKSTLIKLLLGLVKMTAGTGAVLGHDIVKEASAIRAKVGYMPEDDCYMHGLSGIECVQVAARLSCLPSTEGLRRGHEILDFCGMGQERYRNVETYSTGMRQKLRFAMSIVHDPELLILDEPTSGLDPEERQAMLNRIGILSQKFGKAVMICTHILPDVKVVCDHVAILAGGEIQLVDKLAALLKSPSPSVTVSLLDSADLLLDRLVAVGLKTSVTGHEQLQVEGETADVSSKIWEVAGASGIAIQNLRASQSSLEEVFLNAVKETNNANS